MVISTLDLDIVVEDFLSAFWCGDWEAAATLVTTDFYWENRPAEGVLLNFAKMTEVAGAFSSGQNGYPVVDTGHHHVLQSVVGSQVVAQERVDVWKSGRKWFHLPCAGFWRFRGRLICSWTDYFDMSVVTSYKHGLISGDDEAWHPHKL